MVSVNPLSHDASIIPNPYILQTNPESEMYPDTLAIVDVETTGQSAVYGRIIEIAIIRVEKGRVTARFESLVNPECYISPVIFGITGISNEDVSSAPVFSKIARTVFRLLDGVVFVAHNARFDYSFIKSEFAALGMPFNARCLCTVKLSRRLYPQYRHHDLSSVIERHEIECSARHRAMGDAEAVLEFLRIVENNEDHDVIADAVRKILKSHTLPAHLDRDTLEGLPDGHGVYLFYGTNGHLLYVGKSINIRERVRSHFSGDLSSAKETEMCRQVARIETRQTAGELGALLLESQLIKELRPIYNSVARQMRNLVVARRRAVRSGYVGVKLEEIDHIDAGDSGSILGIFKHMKQATEFLSKISREYHLCNKLLGLEKPRGCCFGYQLKHCNGACIGEEPPGLYNRRVEQAFEGRRVQAWPFAGGIAIEEKRGRTGEGEVFLVDNWCLLSSFRYGDLGFGDHSGGSRRFDYDSYKILSRFLQKPSNRRHVRILTKDEFGTLLSEGGSEEIFAGKGSLPE